MKKLLQINLVVMVLIILGFTTTSAQLSGTKYIPGDYSTIAAAIADLNTQGVGSGGVTFLVAAGHTETTSDSLVLTATGTSSDPIVFQKDGSGANPIITRTDAGSKSTSTLGGQGDAVITIQGSDYVTFDGIDVAADQSTIEYGYFLRKNSGTDGCKYVTIKNATVTMNKGTSQYVAGIYSSNLDPSSTPSSATGVTVTSTAGRSENVTIKGCTIQNVFTGILLRGFNHTSAPYDFYDQNFVIGALGEGNLIQNFGGNSANTTYGVYLIYHNNANVSYNTINNTAGGGSNFTATAYGIFHSISTNGNGIYNNNIITLTSNTGQLRGITSGTSGVATLIANNNEITLSQAGTAEATPIYFQSVSAGSTVEINYNTFSYGTFASTTTSYIIYCNNAANNVTVIGNQTSGSINKTGAGTFYGFYNFGSPSGGSAVIQNNNFSNITLTGASTFYGIYYATSVSQPKIISENTISNIVGGTNSIYGIFTNYDGTTSNIYNNNVFNLSATGSSAVYGMSIGGASSSGTFNCYGNNIYNISCSGTGAVYGLYHSGTTGSLLNTYKNNIYNIYGTNASSIVYGLYIAGGTTIYAYNNFISDLKAPAATSTNAISGLYIAGGTNVGAYYNTIFINATSSSATTFGTSGIYVSTTPTVDLRNNIVVNTSTPGPTGGLTVAHRRSGTSLTTYSNLSNNNCFYAGTPAANKLIFNDGTNSDQTMTAYKARVAPRDAASFAENVPFVNSSTPPYDLHISTTTPTQTEGGGTPITSPITITGDFDGDTRNSSTPDVGADEFDGIGLDLTPPTIAYTPLSNAHSGVTTRNLPATITDLSGVQRSPAGEPRIYYKKGVAGTYISGTAVEGPTNVFTFTIDHSLLGGISAGDTIYYYVAAQDSADNAGTNPPGTDPTINPPNATVASPNFYLIVPSLPGGTYTIGTGGNYPTVKAFFDAINGSVVLGNIIGEIISDITETATATLNVINEDPFGSNYTITIRPSAVWVVSGSIAGALIDLNGADRVTFNGDLSGVKSLTFRNTSTTGQTFVLRNGATLNTITNCIVEGANTSATSGTIVFSTSTVAFGGNSNNLITDNIIRDRSDAAGVPANAIYSSGTAGALNANNTISGNNIFNWTGSGILLASTGLGDSWIISSNNLYQTATRTTALTAISVSAGSGHTINGNNIGGSAPDRSGSPMTTSGAFTGISLAVGTTSPTVVNNNLISNIVSTASSACRSIYATSGNVNITSNIIGGGAASYDTLNFAYDNDAISVSGTGLINIENNTIGNIRYNKATPGGDRTCGIYATSTGAMSIQNNIVRNLSSNSTGTSYTFLPVGIYVLSTGNGHIIKGNQIYDITQLNTGTLAYTAVGMYIASVSSSPNVTMIKNNLIKDIYALGTGTGTSSPVIHGIYVSSGSATYANNMIALGTGVGNEVRLRGIEDFSTGTNKYYYNSINIVGTTSAGTNNMYAFRRASTGAHELRNNIFANTRTGGTRAHFALANGNATGWTSTTSNYNVVYSSDPDSVAQWLTDGQSLAGWQTISGGDANTIFGDPGFVSATDLHIVSTSGIPSNNATPLVGIVDDDFDDEPRSATNPDRGADEYYGVPPQAFSLLSPTDGAINVPLNGSLTWEVSQYAATYDVYLDKVDASTLVSPDQTTTSYDYLNLDPNSTYYWKVVAKNANGSTQATGSPWSFTTQALLPPNPPTDLVLSNITTDAMDLSWTDNSTDESGFNIYKSTDGSNFILVDVVGPDVTTYTGDASRSLSPNTRYWWRVTAYNANGESGFAANDKFTLANTPGAPTLSNATMTTMLVTLDPAGNPAATTFLVRVVYGAITKYMTITGTLSDVPVWGTYAQFGGGGGRTLTGLSPLTSYTIDVKARNGNNAETDFGLSSVLSTTGTPYPVFEGFELTTFPPTAWLVENTNGDAKTWVRTTSNVRSGVGAAMYPYSTTLPADDWLFTLPLTMEAGNKYRLTYYYRAYSASYPEEMKVMLGSAQNSASMTQLLADHPNITNTTYAGNSVTIIPPSTGVYYIGFHAYSAANMWNLYIDDITIEVMPQKDIEVLAVNLSAPPYYVGMPITVSAQIRNNGTEDDPTSVPLTYKIGSEPDYQGDGEGEIFTPSWASGIANVTFTVPYNPGSAGNVTIYVKSFYSGDQVPANDTKLRTIKILPQGALFEDWTDVNALARWKVVNNDGGANSWRRATEKFLSSPASAGSDYESSTLRNDDWLITPKLTVSAGDSLTFWHSARSTTYPESLYVRLSVVGNNPSDPWVDLLKIRDATLDWKYKAIDLSPWAGQNVWIAFVNRGLDMWTIYIDDITGPAVYIPEYDLAFTDFYQSSGLPTPKVDKISDREVWMMNETIRDEKPVALLSDKGTVEMRESEISKTVVLPGNSLPTLNKKLGVIDIKAEVSNVGRNAVSYTLDWNVSGTSQPTYVGPSVDSGTTHIAELTFNPTARGTFLTSGTITVAGDENPDNNSNYFRMRVYPDEFTRTIYDRGDNVVDTWVGWGSATRPMKAGVRFTAPQTMRLAGVDFIYNTATVTSGDIIVAVRGAGDSLTGPGPVLYTKIYNAEDYFTGAGDYVTFAFDDDAPVIAGGSDYWITIKMPAGILYPGAVHNSGFTPGRSFYEGAVDLDTTKWYPLVITTERAWIMRSYFVAPPNSIAGMKFNDLNGNGQKDEGEPGLEGWYISLNGPVNDVVQTGPDGSYFFGDLPDGEYLITEDQQVGWIQTMPPAPGSYTVVVSGGMNVTGKDFGNFKLGKISGYKWEDLDGDGIWDVGEPTVANWQINLTGPVSGSTNTNPNGWYQFENLTAGQYTVSENIPAGWFSTYPTPNQHVINIQSGTEVIGNGGIAEVPNFGNARYGTVSGMKFWDRNNNGVKDPGEVGLANWEILLTGDHTLTRSTYTDQDGNFIFENVVPDNYTLAEVVKPGWTNTASPEPFVVISGTTVTDKLFGNFYNKDATRYRSFLPESLVALDAKGKVPKAVKRKPIGAYWEFSIVNIKEYPVTVINIQFKNDVKSIVETGSFDVSGAKKDWMLSNSELAPGDTLVVKGYSLKGKPQEIKKLWLGPKTSIPLTAILPTSQYLELPMPTWANVINEIFTEQGFPDDGGLLIGQKGDPKKIGWVFITKPGDVIKSLYTKALHTGGPKFFRTFDNGKPFLKEQKSLPQTKQNNKLFAELVAAKLAIAASELGKIPEGYGDLIYIDDDIAWHPFNNMTVKEIVDSVSRAMNTFEGDSLDYYRVIRKLNMAFVGPIDTVSFGVDNRVVLTGVRPLSEVPYLFDNPSGKVTKITPKLNAYEEIPSVFELAQNYPNPFNPTTTITFTLPEDAIVSLKVYNILGQEVAVLIDNEIYTEGLNEVEFDAGKLSSGVYFYRITAEGIGENPAKYSQVKKMILMK